MKKILFAVEWYNVDSSISTSANSLCNKYIIDELRKNKELEIHTLSIAPDNYKLEEKIDDVFIHRYRRSLFWNVYFNSRRTPSILRSKIIFRIYRLVLRIKQFVTIPIFPIYEPFHTLSLANRVCKLHKKENFDMIVAEHYGVDTVYAGYCVKKRFPRVNYVPICWDSIAGGNLPKYMPRSLSLYLKKRFEKKIGETSDYMIVTEASKAFHMSNTMADSYRKKMIYLGIPYFLPIEISQSNKKIPETINVVFSGSMTGRNPLYLLELFNSYLRPVVFTFVCHKSFHEKLVKQAGLYNNIQVKCLPYMDHDDLAEIQKKADILVNIGVTNPNAVSGKIFDYMSFGKLIISTTTIDNESCIPYLRKYPKSLIVDERKSVSESLLELERFIEEKYSVVVTAESLLRVFYINTPMAYRKTIENILSDSEQKTIH